MRSWYKRTGRSLLALALILTQLVLVNGAWAQVPMALSTQFDVTGFIQAATLDAPSDVLAGGTITVNNQVIVVPRNTILQMPAAALTWQDVFALAPAPYGPTQTGLALNDVPKPLATYEAHVVGNRVGNAYIAGLIFLSQHSLQSGAGFINFIDYTTGEFRVGGVLNDGTTGARVKVNDPLGRFSPKWTPDPRFTIDENNPTIRSESGYPMCIPRGTANGIGDPFCPDANRVVVGVTQSILTMPAVTNLAAPVVAETRDGRMMAPFKVGDYVSYSGIVVPSDPTLIAAYQVIGNVGLFTDPTSLVHYVATEVMLLGVGGQTVAGAAEATIRTRFEGFSTLASPDPVNPTIIDLFGVDVDCSANASLRNWGAIDVDTGPPNGAVQGRWRFRPPSKVIASPSAGTFLPPTREMVSRIRGVTPVSVPTADGGGLTAGQYQAPIFEYLFPENAGVGTPIVANNFETFPFLSQGSGPLSGPGSPVVGQLSPWPGDPGFLTATSCAPVGPPPPPPPPGPVVLTATASAAPSPAIVNNLVTLTGTASDPTATFSWVLNTRPAPVTLSGANAAQASFTPTVAGTYTFTLTVKNATGTVTVPLSVTVRPAGDQVTILLAQYRTSKQRLTVDAVSTNANAILTMQAFDNTGKAMTGRIQMTIVPGVGWEVILVGIAQPNKVVVTSNLGGTANSGLSIRL